MARIPKWAAKLIMMGVACLGTWFLIHTACVLVAGVRDNVAQTDVAVVLGNRVERDGTPSPRLQLRLDRAAQLYKDGLVRHLIVSGGRGASGHEEADVMKAALVKAGLPDSAIILDRGGYDTWATAVNTKAIMDAQGFKTVTAVSTYYHMLRIRLAFHKAGIPRINTAHAVVRLELRDPYSIVREFLAYYYYLLAH